MSLALPIQTARLEITALEPGDAAALFRIRANPEVARYQGWVPESLEAVEEYLEENLVADLEEPGTWLQLAVRDLVGGQLVGDLGLHAVDPERGQVEIGFTIDPDCQRRGYGLEVVRGALDAFFDELALHRITASVDPRNGASMRLLAKLGFRQEAHHRRSLWFRGEWVDDVIFAMLAEEWRAGREG